MVQFIFIRFQNPAIERATNDLQRFQQFPFMCTALYNILYVFFYQNKWGFLCDKKKQKVIFLYYETFND